MTHFQQAARDYMEVKSPPLWPETIDAKRQSLASDGTGALVFVEQSDTVDEYNYRAQRVLYAGRTLFQNVLLVDTCRYGLALMLDGAIQSAERDETLYHEMLVQPAMLCHPDPRDVLIIGGGEGATLREVLIHESVRSATMVDLDREVVELCREHLLAWHCGAFDDSRARLVFADGRVFVENDDARYDVVIIDVVDMLDNGPAQALYTRQFYERLRRRLRPNAIVVVQGLEFSFADDKLHSALLRTLRTAFPAVHSYRVSIPSFFASWGFLIASDWFDPDELPADAIDRSIRNRLGQRSLRHFTSGYLRASFAKCRETQSLLLPAGPILEDGVDFVPPPDLEDIEPLSARFPIQP